MTGQCSWEPTQHNPPDVIHSAVHMRKHRFDPLNPSGQDGFGQASRVWESARVV